VFEELVALTGIEPAPPVQFGPTRSKCLHLRSARTARPSQNPPQILDVVTLSSLTGSLDGGDPFCLDRACAHVFCDFACESNPISADRLARVFLTRVIQTDTMARCNEGRCQIPSQLNVLIFLHTWP
jgi:hypothetical protein